MSISGSAPFGMAGLLALSVTSAFRHRLQRRSQLLALATESEYRPEYSVRAGDGWKWADAGSR